MKLGRCLLLIFPIAMSGCVNDLDNKAEESGVPLSVLVAEKGSYSSTQATLYFVRHGEVVSQQEVNATIEIGSKLRADEFDELILEKDGYDKLVITKSELDDALRGKPLKCVMRPLVKLAILASENDTDEIFSIDLRGSGTVVVEWEDGTFDRVELPGSVSKVLQEGQYDVKLRGDLDQITSIDPFGYVAGVEKITGLTHLVRLENLELSGYFTSSLDFHRNGQIKSLDLFEVDPRHIRLPKRHYLWALTYTNSGGEISQKEIDDLIDNIYANTVARNIHNGFLHFGATESVSKSAQRKVSILIEKYGWEIFFNY